MTTRRDRREDRHEADALQLDHDLLRRCSRCPEPSVTAKMPEASAPQAPPSAWTPNTSSESS